VEGGRATAARLDLRGTLSTQIVGVVLVHNEDLYVEQAIRNVDAFCDRIHVADHMSTDRTWKIVRRLARELDHVDAVRLAKVSGSHRLVEGYAGTATWVLAVDGDELYDPEGLVRLGEELRAGDYAEYFRLVGNVLNCVELDPYTETATGYLAPPSRPITKLYNFAAIDSWTGCHERLHGGQIVFKPGYGERSIAEIGAATAWEQSSFRCLHVCLLRRSTRDPEHSPARPNLVETGIDRRTRFPRLERLVMRYPDLESSSWKRDRYLRGGLVTKDVKPFLGAAQVSA
jgi:hypothetical protein